MASRSETIDAYFRQKNYYSHITYQPLGQVLVEEVERMGPSGLYLSTAAALCEKEAGGKNIFGCDFGSRWTNEPPYCQVAVTKERVKALIRNVNTGGGQNGVGLTQLTSIGLVQEAEKMGGAHLPRFQMRVGFRYLNSLIAQLGWPAGGAAYNAGAGNWRAVINTYGADMAKKEREWAARLTKATDTPEEESMPEDRYLEAPRDLADRAIEFGRKMVGARYGTGWNAGTWPALSPLYARIGKHDSPAWYRERECICSGLVNVVRFEVAGLPAVGRKQGDDWPGGTAAIGRHLAFAEGSKPYPPVENTPRGWLVWSPYIGERLELQGHVGIALGNGKVLEARVPTLSANRTENDGSVALQRGGAKPYTRVIPPSVWMVK